MLNLSNIKNAIFDALSSCFSLSPNSAAASTLIQPAYTEPENAPRPPRQEENRGACYLSLKGGEG